LVQFSAESKCLSLLQRVQTGSGASKEARKFLLVIKQFGFETEYILPFITVVKNE
jgi:hypothetical protein